MSAEHLNASLIGKPDSACRLQTPALVIDLDAFEVNAERMRTHCAQSGIALRPHTKTHKSIEIARRQLAAGAIGICCAKLGEAEVMAAGGIGPILLTSPVVGPEPIRRLVALHARAPDLHVVVDHPANVAAIDATLRAAGSTRPLGVLIDLDPGLHRTGIAPGADARELARRIAACPNLAFRGLQMYAGNLMHVAPFAERRSASLGAMKELDAFRHALAADGLACEVLTGGGTGTFDIDVEARVLTDLQAGSYLFMDRQYDAIEWRGGEPPFETSLFVATRVVSCNTRGLATTDAGLKSFATDDEPPIIHTGAPPGARYFFFGDEHGGVSWRSEGELALGDLIVAATPHCDPTFNLYDVVHVVSQGRLEAIWRIDARGHSA